MENKLKVEFNLDIQKYFSNYSPTSHEIPKTYESDFTIEGLFITTEGFIGVTMMNSIGFRCGYVGIPTGLISLENGLNELDCHGGVTYTGSGILDSTFQDNIGIFEAKELNKGITFFGWDYGHLGDTSDNETFLKYCPGHYTMPDFAGDSKIWTQEEVLAEIVDVSTQLQNMEWNELNINVSRLKPSKLKAGLQFSNGKIRFLSKGKK